MIGDHVRLKIVTELKDGGYWYSVSADEVRDVSNKEQLAVCLRYPDKKGQIHDEFVGFKDVSGDTTGERLSSKILGVLDDFGIDKTRMRSQCYDGAGNMTGKVKGVGPRIQRQFPRALHFWCTSHQLNRFIVTACDLQMVRNMMGTADKTVRFFNDSAKRQTFLETAIATVESETKRMKLKELCRTRWVERHDALEIFTDFLPAVVNALETYGEKEMRSDALADSSGLLHAITTFQFIMVLMVVFKCLGYIKQLSIVLQGKAMDVVSAMKEVSVITTTLEEVRTDIDMFHDLWYEAAVSLAESVGVEPSMSRICGRQTRRENTQATTASEYYRPNLTVVFLDHLLTEMRTRFGDLQRKAAMGFFPRR